MKLNIGYLYPRIMNIYGDRGNVLAFQKRCEWRGIETEITDLDVNAKVNIEKFDFYFFGGGQDKEQILASKDLRENKANLKQAAENGAVFLTVCGGYQLLGHYYQPHQGPKLLGLGILNVKTLASYDRMIGNILIESNLINSKKIVGFENHSGKTYLGEGVEPLGKVLKGWGNNGEDGFEGARYKNVFGTYMHGSVLPKNNEFCDLLIKLALKRRYGEVELKELNNNVEERARQLAETLR
ncbi:MAG: glutamine amidotransferase [Patescibacteria group bacterium]|jgi:hypothetical protein